MYFIYSINLSSEWNTFLYSKFYLINLSVKPSIKPIQNHVPAKTTYHLMAYVAIHGKSQKLYVDTIQKVVFFSSFNLFVLAHGKRITYYYFITRHNYRNEHKTNKWKKDFLT